MKKVLLLGTGYMAREYYKALSYFEADLVVIGNSKESVEKFNVELNANALSGSIENNRELLSRQQFDCAYITVNEPVIFDCLNNLKDFSIKNYFIEKPGALSLDDCKKINEEIVSNTNSNYFIAYNRRFYQSVKMLKKLLAEDGGAVSANFEFTELADRILSLNISKERLENWLFLNSSHVIDLAFYLIGWPKEMTSMNKGEKSWHVHGDIFGGFGMSEKDVPFTYSANWNAPGRWSVEVLSTKRRFALRPLEGLIVQERNKFVFEDIELTKSDIAKEGIPELVKASLDDDYSDFLKYDEQLKKLDIYKIINEGGTYASI